MGAADWSVDRLVLEPLAEANWIWTIPAPRLLLSFHLVGDLVSTAGGTTMPGN